MQSKKYVPLRAARERIVATLFMLDQDIEEWKKMRDALRADKKLKRGAMPISELESEFNTFFASSLNIRQKLTDNLSLLAIIHDN